MKDKQDKERERWTLQVYSFKIQVWTWMELIIKRAWYDISY